MEQVLQQLQQLNGVYAQLLTTINAQQQHLKLLIHLLQVQQQQVELNNASNNIDLPNQFVTDSINGFISSLQQLGNTLNNLVLPHSQSGITQNELSLSNVQLGAMQNEFNSSNIQSGITQNELSLSNVELGITQNGLNSSNIQLGVTQNGLNSSNVQSGITTNNIVEGINKIDIDITKLNMSSFRSKIKAWIVKCSRPSAMAAAKILVELYKNPKQSHSSLIKISGFSVGGLSKHIAMLKRRGLIVRTAYQQYELTNLALQMMRDSVFING
jgi:hypothetical protein